MPWIQMIPRGNAEGKVDDITIAVKRWRLKWYIIPVLEYVEETTLRSAVNEIEWKVIDAIEKLLKLLADHKVLSDTLEKEIKEELGSREYDRVSGRSKPILLNEKDFKARVKPFTERPKPDWIQFFNFKIIREFNLNRKPIDRNPDGAIRRAGDFQNRARGLVPGEPGGTIGVTLQEHQKFAVHLRDGMPDVDQFVTHKEDKGQGGGNDKKSQMKKLRQDNPFDQSRWENQKEWNQWIEEEWQRRFGRDHH